MSDRAAVPGPVGPDGPGPPPDLARGFRHLQLRLPGVLATAQGLPLTVVVVPSFSVDNDLLARASELRYWDHRMLYVLGRLRDPAVRVVYATGPPVSEAAVRYHLDLLGAPTGARDRLTLVTCGDAGPGPLARRLLARPDLVEAVAAAVPHPGSAYLECFASTPLEQELAVRLGVPLHGPDPALAWLGGKGQSRRLFRDLGIPVPAGVEGVRGVEDLVGALVELHRADPRVRAAVVKLDDSVGGVGNAVVRYPAGAAGAAAEREVLRRELADRLELALPVLDAARFLERVEESGCVVEHLVEPVTRSPSVQCLIGPDGAVEVAATHDQELSGPTGQHFAGAWMPSADPGVVEDAARAVGVRLAGHGVVGWFGVDFVTTDAPAGPRYLALEINLRSVGTVHHLLTLRTLVGGRYVAGAGRYLAADGAPRTYFGTDSVVLPGLTGVGVQELVDASAREPWGYRPARGTGTVLHLLDAVGPLGRVGVTCVGRDRDDAARVHRAALAGLARLVVRSARAVPGERAPRTGRTATGEGTGQPGG